MNEQIVLQCQHVGKFFQLGGERVDVLSDIDFSVAASSSTAIMGASGCGKSTLLHILGGLELPSSGEVSVGGQTLNAQTRAALPDLRNRYLGFVYQFHHLLGDLTALENVIMPLLIGGMARKEAKLAGLQWLAKVDLAGHAHKKPGYLSGGERQRVAIARALVHAPKCVLADEPTANLDPANARMVLGLLLELCRENGSSLVLATHDAGIAAQLQRTVRIVAGRLQLAP
jgi:lipoprotein-releasing system ATP-binding protein